MTKEELALFLDGIEYPVGFGCDEGVLSDHLCRVVTKNKLIIITCLTDGGLRCYGLPDCDWVQSKRCCHFVFLRKGDMYLIDEYERLYYKAEEAEIYDLSHNLEAANGNRDICISWGAFHNDKRRFRITSTMPHSEFTIKRKGKVYANGIVIDTKALSSIKYNTGGVLRAEQIVKELEARIK